MSHSTPEPYDSRGEFTEALFEGRPLSKRSCDASSRPSTSVMSTATYRWRVEAELGPDDGADLLRGVAEVTGVVLRGDLLDGGASLDDFARAVAVGRVRWQVTITFEREQEFGTRATAVLTAGLDQHRATGEAGRTRATPTSLTSAATYPPPAPWPSSRGNCSTLPRRESPSGTTMRRRSPRDGGRVTVPRWHAHRV